MAKSLSELPFAFIEVSPDAVRNTIISFGPNRPSSKDDDYIKKDCLTLEWSKDTLTHNS